MRARNQALAARGIAADQRGDAVGFRRMAMHRRLLALGALQHPARRAEVRKGQQPVVDERQGALAGQRVGDVDDMDVGEFLCEIGEREIGGAHAVAVAAGAALGDA